MSPVRRWVLGGVAVASGASAWAILAVVAAGEGLLAWAAIFALALALTAWLGIRAGDRIGRYVE
jgi:hypothetical protein